MNIGEKIIDEIIKQGMVSVVYQTDESTVFVWAANAAEQLEALVNREVFSQSPKEQQ